MLGMGHAGVQRTLKNIISKRSKAQHRLDTASNQLGAASASQASALLGVLIQHECSKASETSRSNPKRHQGEAALCALGRQSRCLAADAPRVVQQHVLATAARVTPMERNTLPASSIHGVQPASQQAATPASSSNHASCSAPEYNSLPLQQPRHMASDMQQSCSGVFPACDRAAAQHAQLKHQAPQTSGMQSLPRPQNQQNRQHQRQGRLREHCDRGPLQQRPGAAHHRQPSKRRRPQVHVFGAGLGRGQRQPLQLRAPPTRPQRFNHYDNGRGLWDGDMAGLDGLETVGLDCWEGFGTVSMGRL